MQQQGMQHGMHYMAPDAYLPAMPQMMPAQRHGMQQGVATSLPQAQSHNEGQSDAGQSLSPAVLQALLREAVAAGASAARQGITEHSVAPDVVCASASAARGAQAPHEPGAPLQAELSEEVRGLASELRVAGRVLTGELRSTCRAFQDMQRSMLRQASIPSVPPALAYPGLHSEGDAGLPSHAWAGGGPCYAPKTQVEPEAAVGWSSWSEAPADFGFGLGAASPLGGLYEARGSSSVPQGRAASAPRSCGVRDRAPAAGMSDGLLRASWGYPRAGQGSSDASLPGRCRGGLPAASRNGQVGRRSGQPGQPSQGQRPPPPSRQVLMQGQLDALEDRLR
eukprot:CAMPEP_0170585244 /NCGR_PEP_ID=MMETSP0224-20130122/9107_1 /TAXON_ID=285029 /ORGANISM="Togula jolla, Strain CCCM 725" /LENGTH=336 /DNA_ID=CAMNT_0010908709 /DNA_START=65 /DNA_END=1072 /DNA_ORIENTATION=+